MKTTIHSFISILFLSAVSIGAGAQSLPSLLVGSDAASLGKAGVSVSSAAGAYALENNVAAMSLAKDKFNAGVSYGMWQPDYAGNKVMGAGAMFKATGSLAFGASFKYLSSPSYDTVTESGTTSRDGSFTPKEFNIALGASYAFNEYFSAGLTARFLNSSLAEESSATVFGADLGIFFSKNSLSAGLSVNNLGSKANYGEDSAYSQPMLVKAGAGYDFGFGKSVLGISAEADYLFEGAFAAGAAAQYGWNDTVFLRCGYHYGDSSKGIPSYASAGVGVKFFGININAAYILASEVLKKSLSISLGYSF